MVPRRRSCSASRRLIVGKTICKASLAGLLRLMPTCCKSKKVSFACVRGRFLFVLLVLQFCLPIHLGHSETVHIAYSSISGAMAPLWMAHDYGFFRAQGLDVQLLYRRRFGCHPGFAGRR